MAGNHPFIKVAGREIKRISKEGVSYFVVFLGPLFAFFLISSIFYSGVPRKLPVAIVDLDHTDISRKAARMTDATPIAQIDRSYTSLSEARTAMLEGRVDAVLLIPGGTEKEILKGGSATIALYINNTNIIKGSLLNSGIQKALSTLSAGIKLQKHLQGGETEDQAMAQILPVQMHSDILFNPFTSYAYFITLILLPVMLTVFTLFGTLYAIGSELQYGTGAQWLITADNSIIIALAGKLLPYTLCYCAVATCMNLDLFYFLGLPLRGSLGVLVLSELLLVLSYQAMAIVFITLTKNMRLALSLASAYTMLAITYAGFTFPVFGMPVIAQIFSRIFPVTYWVGIFSGQSLRAEPLSNSFSAMNYLVGFIVFGCLFIPRLKYVLRNEKYWWKI
jgi:ABC-2 type transport system permease protein